MPIARMGTTLDSEATDPKIPTNSSTHENLSTKSFVRDVKKQILKPKAVSFFSLFFGFLSCVSAVALLRQSHTVAAIEGLFLLLLL